MACTILYTSTQACPPVLDLALTLRAKGYQLRTLGQLPTPLPARRASLRLELAGLQQDERTIRWTLSQYREGLRLPDACREADLLSDLDVTLWRLAAVAATLQALATQPALA
ncbi:MAG: hypothetical protein ACRYFZ_03510 [Janthinobacterium lividum]